LKNFSQLCSQFKTRNYAKTLLGFKTGILLKIAGLAITQYVIVSGNKPIS